MGDVFGKKAKASPAKESAIASVASVADRQNESRAISTARKAVWTGAHNEQAMQQGWLISDTGKIGRRRWELQKFDNCLDINGETKFRSDEQAWLHVWARGCAGSSSLEGRALDFLFVNSPEEHRQIAVYSWQRKAVA